MTTIVIKEEKNMEDKTTIRIMLDFLAGPIWFSEPDCLYTGIPVLDNDDVLLKLNNKICDMYSSYYEFDSHDQGCWFDTEREKAEKDEMLDLLTQLIDRLNELNDGSFVIDDRETERVKKL